MFDVKQSEILAINEVHTILNPDVKLNAMGGWGIMHLVCGALSAYHNLSRQATILSYLDNIDCSYLKKRTTDEEVALDFAEYVKKWSIDEWANDEAEKSVAKVIKGNGVKWTEKTYPKIIQYTALSIMLNTIRLIDLREADIYDLSDDFIKAKEWADKRNDGWPVLFFATGLILSVDDEFRWEEYGSALLSMGGAGKKKRIDDLFSSFGNKR